MKRIRRSFVLVTDKFRKPSQKDIGISDGTLHLWQGKTLRSDYKRICVANSITSEYLAMTSALKLPDCISHQGQLPNDVNASKVLSSEIYTARIDSNRETQFCIFLWVGFCVILEVNNVS
jgi:hypothetical protein